MRSAPIRLALLPLAAVLTVAAIADDPPAADTAPPDSDRFVSGVRQITFEGRRAGEGYFSADGDRMIFQSERDPANPFYQIYLMDLTNGDVERVSTGVGKTTCAWLHPSGDRALYAATHHDPASEKLQRDELDARRAGTQRRYAWDYDPQYELYEQTIPGGEPSRLTDAPGYDAEGSYSPDGTRIVFASNRAAYNADGTVRDDLTERQRELFDLDPAAMNDIYVMDADGSNLTRLTDTFGYDGGPFFSADGEKICWRRFSEDGATAEIYVMNADGSDPTQMTHIGAMSWAPYFHPSGDYLIFTTNVHGFANFELYLVAAEPTDDTRPVRVTSTEGFDGLPVFTPDGDGLSWTSNRTDSGRSQIFLADWDHAAARRALGLDDAPEATAGSADADPDDADRVAAAEAATRTADGYEPIDVRRHVDYLTRKELGGRLTGTDGERRATAYVAAYLDSLGYLPAGEDGTFFQSFDFPAGSSIEGDNAMAINDRTLTLDEDYRPLSFSGDGTFAAGEVVFAGYGLQVPPDENGEGEYDSYVHLNPAGRWVMAFRDLPQDITPEQRQRMARYGSPRRKATIARDAGAKGLILVTGPTSGVRNDLIRFDSATSGAGVSMAVVSVTDAVAQSILDAADEPESLEELQRSFDDGQPRMGFSIADVDVTATVNITRRRGTGRNVLARLPATDATDDINYPVVVVGAHIDHLGRGGGGNSLAREDEQDNVHFGADDNASGVAAMLEIAQDAAASRAPRRRDLIVAAWSGEELGLFGSQAFVENLSSVLPDAPEADVDPDAARVAAAHGMTTDAAPISGVVGAYLNLDMVGRLREKLVVQGVGSSPGFAAAVRRRNVPIGLDLSLDQTSTRLPTDASSFVARDVPILSLFTGAHEDYHRPTDTADKLNYDGTAKIANLGGLIVRGWLTAEDLPKFELADDAETTDDQPRARLTAYLGTIPDYVASDVQGVKLSGVGKNGPADQAGVRGGDIIIKLAGRKIEGIYDYTYAIEALKIGEEVEMVVRRGEQTVPIRITPGSRE